MSGIPGGKPFPHHLVQFIVFNRFGDIVFRSQLHCLNSRIDFTVGGREPAISPDGQHLAFSIMGERGDYDIWVVTLELLP